MLCTRWKIHGMLHHIFVYLGRWLHGIGQCKLETLSAERLKINYCASAKWEVYVAGKQFKWKIFVLCQWPISYPGTIQSFKIKSGICTESDCKCHFIVITIWVARFILKTKILLAIFIVKFFCPLSRYTVHQSQEVDQIRNDLDGYFHSMIELCKTVEWTFPLAE